MRRSKLESVDIHQPGLVREVMRNIDFKLNIEVADVASPPPRQGNTRVDCGRSNPTPNRP